jgi:transcription antitermination factor NusB
MRKRTVSREIALKVLYAWDITKDTLDECLERQWEKGEDDPGPDIRKFTNEIVRGFAEHHKEIDGIISKYATNWELGRMATIDRNIMRMATFELLFVPDVPVKVAINEAIEMAKKFGDKDSGKFVNGVLDKISKTEKKRD